jgi:hypothetical protein
MNQYDGVGSAHEDGHKNVKLVGKGSNSTSSKVMDDNQTSGFPNNVPSTTTTTTATNTTTTTTTTTTTATNTTSPSSHLYSFSADKTDEYSILHCKKIADKVLANSKVSGLTPEQVWTKAQTIKGLTNCRLNGYSFHPTFNQ